MIKKLKTGTKQSEKADENAQVRLTVEKIIADISERGDLAVREYAQKFDKFVPESFLLSHEEIEDCIGSLPEQVLADIKFAQAQVRRFAQIQKMTLRDVEVETLPGVVLGHKNIPVESVGCYIPGGKYPLVASAHMSVLTAKVAGVKRIVACAPPPQWSALPRNCRRNALGWGR